MPSAEEMALMRTALLTAVERGIEAIEREHHQATAQARAAIRAIQGLELTVLDAEASDLSTTIRLEAPELERSRLLADLAAAGFGEIRTAPDPRNVR
jgi:aspartate aminotransferase-like enzyme